MAAHRAKVPDESAIAKALDHGLTRWIALTRCLEDGPCRRITTTSRIKSGRWHCRSNWLFAGSLRAGQRAAAVMSLMQSAKLNATIRMLTSRIRSWGCQHSPPVASQSCSRTAGSRAPPALRRTTRQDGFAERLRKDGQGYKIYAPSDLRVLFSRLAGLEDGQVQASEGESRG